MKNHFKISYFRLTGICFSCLSARALFAFLFKGICRLTLMSVVVQIYHWGFLHDVVEFFTLHCQLDKSNDDNCERGCIVSTMINFGVESIFNYVSYARMNKLYSLQLNALVIHEWISCTNVKLWAKTMGSRFYSALCSI